MLIFRQALFIRFVTQRGAVEGLSWLCTRGLGYKGVAQRTNDFQITIVLILQS
jgi:hypothetical protein